MAPINGDNLTNIQEDLRDIKLKLNQSSDPRPSNLGSLVVSEPSMQSLNAPTAVATAPSNAPSAVATVPAVPTAQHATPLANQAAALVQLAARSRISESRDES